MSDDAGEEGSQELPSFMAPLAVASTRIDGKEAILVGALPHGYTVILCPRGWKQLQRNKLSKLRAVGGKVRACGEGRSAGYVVSRFLTGASGNHVVSHRNGNLFDLRLSNLAVLSRGLLRQAETESTRGANYGLGVQLSDGRWRSCRRPESPSAKERIQQAISECPSVASQIA